MLINHIDQFRIKGLKALDRTNFGQKFETETSALVFWHDTNPK